VPSIGLTRHNTLSLSLRDGLSNFSGTCEGIGEMPNIPAAPAITNAIANAVGARVYDLPAHCERVYTAIKKRLAGGN